MWRSMNLHQLPPWHHLPLCSSPAAGAHLLWPALVLNFTLKFSFKLEDQELRYNRQSPQDEAPKHFSYFSIFDNPHIIYPQITGSLDWLFGKLNVKVLVWLTLYWGLQKSPSMMFTSDFALVILQYIKNTVQRVNMVKNTFISEEL